MFEALLSAHGVGPSLALAILGVHPPASLLRVLADDDLAALCLVPGVGQEDRGPPAGRAEVPPRHPRSRRRRPSPRPPTGGGTVAGVAGRPASPMADVRDALTNLGYGPDEVAEAVRDLPDEPESSELLRLALQKLAAA